MQGGQLLCSRPKAMLLFLYLGWAALLLDVELNHLARSAWQIGVDAGCEGLSTSTLPCPAALEGRSKACILQSSEARQDKAWSSLV